MASVRASLMTQARMAAQRIDTDTADAAMNPVVEQLVRCAKLSQDAGRTLEWAHDTLRAHGNDRADGAACQLLRAAIARIDTVRRGKGDEARADRSSSLAWR